MIQNIQFPEGTQVVYQKGSAYDQFDKSVKIDPSTASNSTLVDGIYTYSQLSSAKEFVDMPMDYCFYYSDCVFRINKTTYLYHTFDSGIYMYDLIFDKNITVSLDSSFSNATVPTFFSISANATNINNLFYGYSSSVATYINWDIDTSNIKTISNVFNQYTKAVYGNFSIKSLGNVSYSTITGYGSSSLRQITITDIGTNQSQTSVDCSYWTTWGINSSAIPNARQSLIDSLITYSFDRAAAGYSTCTIKLAAKTKALLTEEEIAQITAKGFTIA